MDFVHKQDVPAGVFPELVLGVHQDQASLRCRLRFSGHICSILRSVIITQFIRWLANFFVWYPFILELNSLFNTHIAKWLGHLVWGQILPVETEFRIFRLWEIRFPMVCGYISCKSETGDTAGPIPRLLTEIRVALAYWTSWSTATWRR